MQWVDTAEGQSGDQTLFCITFARHPFNSPLSELKIQELSFLISKFHPIKVVMTIAAIEQKRLLHTDAVHCATPALRDTSDTYQIKWSNVVLKIHVAISLPSCRDGLMWPFDTSTTPTIITLNILTTSPCEPRWSDVTLCCLNHSPLHHICYHPTDAHICRLSSNIKSTYLFIAF